MLDKSIPYQNIIMCADRDHLICMEEPVLPEGFSFRLFCPGDEKAVGAPGMGGRRISHGKRGARLFFLKIPSIHKTASAALLVCLG